MPSAPASARHPVLLTTANYRGTIAIARCLGRAGISLTVATDGVGLPAAWSKWTSRRVRCPTLNDPQRFIDWLLEFGSREPRHVLYPTTDDLAFLYARNASELGQGFFLYQPSVTTLLTLLDKASLVAAARTAGLDTPETYVLADEAELQRIGHEARFPLLIKPRAHLLSRTQTKGVLVRRREDLLDEYRAYMRRNGGLRPLLVEWPDIAHPMLQEYLVEAEVHGVFTVSGFVDETGSLFVARASRKMLQEPRRMGVGICFEDAPLDPGLSRQVAALCARTGYFGVFDAEFIQVGDRKLFIDFNPRYYNQIGFEIACGLPLPLLVYFAAVGDAAGLERAVRVTQSSATSDSTSWCHRFTFAVLTTAQGLSGAATAAEVESWRAWYTEHRDSIVDATFDREDRLPWLLDIVLALRAWMRHPRAFVRTIVLNR